jgi:hypothetical protein
LATIDQFLATCAHPRWHQWNNIRFARSIIIGAVIVWILHGIPFLLYYNHTLLPNTSKASCVITNVLFQKYLNVFYGSVITTSLPVIIIILFGSLTYRNVKQIAYRTVPLVRRELDKQLTVMVLVEVLFDVVFITPLAIQSILFSIINVPSNSDIAIQLNSIKIITTIITYFRFVVGINCIKTFL